MIDWKVAKAQQDKMAGSSGESGDVLIQSLMRLMNKNTLQSTNRNLEVLAAQKGSDDESIEKYESEALDKIIRQVYATVRKKDGDYNEPDSLSTIGRSLIERVQKFHLSRQGV